MVMVQCSEHLYVALGYEWRGSLRGTRRPRAHAWPHSDGSLVHLVLGEATLESEPCLDANQKLSHGLSSLFVILGYILFRNKFSQTQSTSCWICRKPWILTILWGGIKNPPFYPRSAAHHNGDGYPSSVSSLDFFSSYLFRQVGSLLPTPGRPDIGHALQRVRSPVSASGNTKPLRTLSRPVV